MTPSDKKVYDLVCSLYETVGDKSPESWLDTYQQMAAILSAGPGGLSLYIADNKDFEILAATLNTELFEQYRDYYQYISPFRSQITSMKAGEHFSRAKSLSDREFLKTEIYQDYFKKQDIFNFEYRVFFSESNVSAGVSFSRPQGMKNFNSAEIKTMHFFIRHIQNAFQIYRKFAELQHEQAIFSECLEKIAQSIIVLDKSGKIVFLTDSARRFFFSRKLLRKLE